MAIQTDRSASPARLASDQLVAGAVLLGSAALLLGALGFQYLGGLAPCPLCVWQRVPHAVVIVLLLSSFFRLSTRLALALAALALLVGAGIAGYHVGVEQGLLTSSCDGGLGATSLEDLRAQVMAQSGPACSQVAWSLFGVSMAGWNLVASLGLAALAVFGLFRRPGAA
ncbi:disulfide bond formation protein B [Marinivivus vitaminiproducens]|uniref:disulfide bond formation protein B n=1 Tax=Marinivivus vitaminiproducens TaxID=3035935 RepID=UPI0027A58C90|nr:disulfide bond formation protein B [Geminicoccaceae bacterium SCSIO 64248]